MSLYLGNILHAEKCWKLGFIQVSLSPFICLIDEMVEVTDFGLAQKKLMKLVLDKLFFREIASVFFILIMSLIRFKKISDVQGLVY